MLCIVKCLKEDRKSVFQMRNKVCSTTMSRTKLKQQKNNWIKLAIYRSHPSLVRNNHLAKCRYNYYQVIVKMIRYSSS